MIRGLPSLEQETAPQAAIERGARRDHPRTIGGAISRWAEVKGGAAALVGLRSRSVTFAELNDSVSSFATQLEYAGLRREDRVGLLVPPGVAGAHLVVALAANVTLVPVNPALKPGEVTEFCARSGVKALVIPAWLDTPARPAILESGTTAIEATLTADGVPRLQLGRRRTQPREPLRPAREADVAVLLRSSGSTGAPKLIPVTHGNLAAMAERFGWDLWFKLSAQDSAACTLPLYYAAGLKMSLLVPLLLGQPVSFPPPGNALDLAHWVDELRPSFLWLAPPMLSGMVRRLSDSARHLGNSSLRFVVCGAAYLPEEVRLAAESILRVPVLESYMLSEAGVMAANPAPPGRIKPGTVGLPAPGELLLVDENRKPVADGAVGEIMIAGPTVTPGYIVTTGEAGSDEWRDGWLLTGDLGRLDSDGYLTLVGRVKEMINRGGEKVFPYEVEKAMLQHPAVQEAAAFGVPHPRLGESVAAAAVLKPASAVTQRELKEFLAERLAGFKLPRTVHIVSSLPRVSTGKVLRPSLSAAFAAVRREAAPPLHLLEVELRDVWRRLLGRDDIGVDDDFLEIGGDSLLAMEMLVEVERLTGQGYPRSELSTLTIRRIHEVVSRRMVAQPHTELLTQVKAGPGVPVFFCHGDYLTRGIYAHKLSALLPDTQPVFLLHSDGERFFGWTIEQVAEAYLHEVLRVAPHAPLFVGGYCNGGLVAWHLAHLLRSKGVEVVQLLLVETPSLNARNSLRWLALLFRVAGAVTLGPMRRFFRQKAMALAWTRRRGFADFWTLARRAARNRILPWLGWRATPQTRSNALDMESDLYVRIARYVPPRLDIEATCFIAQAGNRFDTDPAFWSALLKSVSEVRVPGTHFSAIISERQALAAALAEVLGRATARYRAAPRKSYEQPFLPRR